MKTHRIEAVVDGEVRGTLGFADASGPDGEIVLMLTPGACMQAEARVIYVLHPVPHPLA